MKKAFKKILDVLNNRYLMLYIIIILISAVFILRLFSLQIINGAEYREQSEKRMLRTETIEAPRGEIYDRNGVVLATSKRSYNVTIYKVNVEVEEQNEAISKLVDILEANGDSIYSTFPVNDELNGFSFSDDNSEKNWKKDNNIDEAATFEDTIKFYTEKYALENYTSNFNHLVKMIEIKYEGNVNAYSLLNSAVVAKDIKEESVAQIEERKSELYGINIVSSPKRYYTNANLFSHVIGYVSNISSDEYSKKKDEGYSLNSIIGKTGVEQSCETYLKGTDGVKKVETDRYGNITSETITKEAVTGNSVTLTLDYRLQKTAQEALEKTIADLREGRITGRKIPDANSGAVVVLDCQTGEVLAMVNYPNYDTNLFVGGIKASDWKRISEDALNPMYNRAISGTYSPGSTYKMLVAFAGLETGGITVDEKYYDPGVYPYGHRPVCWLYSSRRTTHGYVNVSGAIKGSCNCYFYEVGRRIGIAKIVEYSKLFGLGKKTGIELPQESPGQIAGADDSSEDGLKSPWYLGDTLSAAIGQHENQYTPIQLANYISAIANGGTLNKVSVLKEIKNESTMETVPLSDIEKTMEEFTNVKFESRKINIKEEYLNAIKEGMLSVTTETGGTANIVFKNSNIKVAGKTGTSQVSSGTNNGLFVGFAPYDNPKIAVVAIIEHGEEGTYTANVVKPIMEEYFKISEEDKLNEKEQNVVDNKVEF